MDALLMGSYSTSNSLLPYRFESRNQVGIKMFFFRKAETDLMEAVSYNVFTRCGKEFD